MEPIENVNDCSVLACHEHCYFNLVLIARKGFNLILIARKGFNLVLTARKGFNLVLIAKKC